MAMPGDDTRSRRRRALTLVELLVVLASIALLLALAVPALNSAGTAARSARCTAQLRQLHAATVAYANVYTDRFPAAILHFTTPVGLRTVAWDATLEPADGGASGAIGPGPLAVFLDTRDDQRQCPEFHGTGNFGADPFGGYNYNTTFIGAEGAFPYFGDDGKIVDGWAAARPGVPGALHRRPSETALFGDGGYGGGANRFMRAPGNSVEFNLGLLYAGGQAFRHGDGCNVVHLDGHCSTCRQPRRGVHATDALLGIMDFPRNGFLSDDDSAYDPR